MPAFSRVEAEVLMGQVPGWKLDANASKISRDFTFKDFAQALVFVNKVGAIAESEGHHPDIELGWGKVGISLTTHAIHGLSENDFIMAAKIDKIA
jgi:4a-hydroxytetrahydrobiopterin dehydratase